MGDESRSQDPARTIDFTHVNCIGLPGGPPGGAAGGALAGNYPNPTLAVPLPGGPPTGAAGGALAGTFPNPSLAVPLPGGPPTGAAGGVLSGTYPNPGFAVSPSKGYLIGTPSAPQVVPASAAVLLLFGTILSDPLPSFSFVAGTGTFLVTGISRVYVRVMMQPGAITGDTWRLDLLTSAGETYTSYGTLDMTSGVQTIDLETLLIHTVGDTFTISIYDTTSFTIAASQGTSLFCSQV